MANTWRDYTVTLVINPSSGSGLGRRLLESARQLALSAPKLTVLDITQANSAQALPGIRASAYLGLAGGDGTISSLLAKLDGFCGKVFLLPLGTGNDLARELSTPKVTNLSMLEQRLDCLLGVKQQPLQVWRLEQQGQQYHFCNYASFGFEASVLWKVDQWRKQHSRMIAFFGVSLTRLVYVLFSLPLVLFSQRFAVELEGPKGKQRRAPISSVIFSNIKPIMGLAYSNSQSDATDQLIEAVLCPRPWDYLRMFILRVFPRLGPELLVLGPGQVIRFPESVSGQLDGEALATPLVGEFTLAPAHRVQMLLGTD
jgi:diacylglycerol kinase family enzyme